MRIYLIGFMGAGKTRLGKKLAQLMGYPFLDLDELIIKQESLSINGIFDQFGETYFRDVEKKTLQETAKIKDAIISTGGGTPCFYDNIKWINKHGLSIYLDVDQQILTDRLWKGRDERPLLQKLSKEGLSSFISNKISERKSFYHQAVIQYKISIEDQESAEELYDFFNFSK